MTRTSTPPLSIDDLTTSATGPQLRAWLEAMQRIGGCASPVYLTGHSITRDTTTGQVVHVFTSTSQPFGRLAVACRNRRASRCQPCSWLHQGDTYHLIITGLLGGKGVPEQVRAHPRVFATLTAPSFGTVHRAMDGVTGERCHPRRDAQQCAHGVREHCPARHAADNPAIGTPLCPDCYDYPGAVLWNASAGRLWNRFTQQVRYNLAVGGGHRAAEHAKHVRVSFAKVAEFQRRGNIHFHAVIRIDPPAGPDTADPPAWATTKLLTEAIHAAALSVHAPITDPDREGETLRLRFGTQVDVQNISPRDETQQALTDGQVAGYIAKYVTKGDLPGLLLDRRLRTREQIDATPLSEHARTLMRSAWDLGQRPTYAKLNLQAWAHQLGFRGNIATKSRTYSTTYTALRQARADHRRQERGEPSPDSDTSATTGQWTFHHQGHTPTEAMYAAGIADDIATARDVNHEARQFGDVG